MEDRIEVFYGCHWVAEGQRVVNKLFIFGSSLDSTLSLSKWEMRIICESICELSQHVALLKSKRGLPENYKPHMPRSFTLTMESDRSRDIPGNNSLAEEEISFHFISQ